MKSKDNFKKRKIKGTIIWTALCSYVGYYVFMDAYVYSATPYICLLFIWGLPMIYTWRKELM